MNLMIFFDKMSGLLVNYANGRFLQIHLLINCIFNNLFDYTTQRNIILIKMILILLADGTTVVGFMSQSNQTTGHNIYRL